MHYKAPRSCSTTCIAKHFRSRGSSSMWLPRRRRGGRAGWEGSKGKKGSLALDRLLVSCKLPLVRNMFYLLARVYLHFRARTPSFVRSPLQHHPSTLFPVRPFVFVRRSTQSHETQGVWNFSLYISFGEPYECSFPFYFPIIAMYLKS